MASGVTSDTAVSAARPDFRKAIDWQRPWMMSLRDVGEPLCVPGLDWRAAMSAIACDARLMTSGGKQIEFVEQSSLPRHLNYEAFINATGMVPTRDNAHDFLNALVWLTYPWIKAKLNAVQAADISAALASALTASAPLPRSRLRDALTLFDENAVLVAYSDPLLMDLLRSHAWTPLFIDHRHAFREQCEVFAFGHALIEKLVTPYKAITAHAWLVPVDTPFFVQSMEEKRIHLDIVVAQQLDETLRTAAFTPLPVLGIPGWWDSQSKLFYVDDNVFRPLRRFSKIGKT